MFIKKGLYISKLTPQEASVVKGIGHKIRAARFNKGKEWTQKRLADQAGLSQGYISAIERGDEFPSLKALKRIGEVLDAPLGYFIDELDDVDAPLTEAKTFKRTNHGDSLETVKENLAAIFEEMLNEKSQSGKNNKGMSVRELQDEVIALKKRVSSIESTLKRATKQ